MYHNVHVHYCSVVDMYVYNCMCSSCQVFGVQLPGGSGASLLGLSEGV